MEADDCNGYGVLVDWRYPHRVGGVLMLLPEEECLVIEEAKRRKDEAMLRLGLYPVGEE